MITSSIIKTGDCLRIMKTMPSDSVDMVFCSPPYEDARTYGFDFKLRGQEWVEWALERYVECVRVCRGLVAWVVEGKTKQFRYSASPILLMADLHRNGVQLRKPPVFHRVGIPGSGGPDWLRNDYEFVVCSSKGKFPWSDNTAMGHPPKYAPGGEMSYRNADGRRKNESAGPRAKLRWGKNQWGGSWKSGNNRRTNGDRETPGRPSHKVTQKYDGVTKANPGNVIQCKVGGGHMGSKLCHENEAPFPESLAEFFIKSFCRPNGVVLDPFCGSGTTLSVANQFDRRAIGIDIRPSQSELTKRRLEEIEK